MAINPLSGGPIGYVPCYTFLWIFTPNGERCSSEVASLLEELYVRVLLREGEPTVLREAEEVLLLVVDKA